MDHWTVEPRWYRPHVEDKRNRSLSLAASVYRVSGGVYVVRGRTVSRPADVQPSRMGRPGVFEAKLSYFRQRVNQIAARNGLNRRATVRQ